MVKRISAAVRGCCDENFVLCARTDARAGEGLDAAIDRAKAYIDAGADLIFPEAMRDLGEFEKFAKAVDAPILANMTEFGKSELFTTQQLESAGVKLVIYPVTTLRLAMGAIKRGLQVIRKEGTQESLVSTMQTRADLYETIHYGVQRVRRPRLQLLTGGSPVTEQEIKKGLAGVVVDTTEISKVVQETNSLTYRGYPVQELAANCSFEEVAYLIWNGELPNAEQLAEFTKRERSQRDIDPKLVDLILGLPKDTHPMHVVQTAVAYLGAVLPPTRPRSSPEADRAKAERLYAQLPTVVAIDHRRRHGLHPDRLEGRPTYAENFFHMVFGEVPAKKGSRSLLRHFADPLRRALLQRIDLHRSRHHVDDL